MINAGEIAPPMWITLLGKNCYDIIDSVSTNTFDGTRADFSSDFLSCNQAIVLPDVNYLNANGIFQVCGPPLPDTINRILGSCTTNPFESREYGFFTVNPILIYSLSAGFYRPSMLTPINFWVSNPATYTPVINAEISITIPNGVSYSSSSNNFSGTPSVSGNVITFSNINMNPNQIYSGTIWVLSDNNLTIGSVLCANMQLSYNSNTYTETSCDFVVNSYDPNMKEVAIDGQPAEGFVPANKTMTYTLHFQNTGNAPAFNVLIKDTLDTDLDISSFSYLGSSHPVYIRVDSTSRECRFYFYDINLPDSATNPQGSQGYVKFSVNQKPNLAPGTEIKNNCSIYFDTNPPIVTNTVTSIIQYPTSVAQSLAHTIQITPNPAKDKLFVQTSFDVFDVQILDVTGKLLLTSSSTKEINIQQLPKGLYFVKVSHNDIQKTFKLVKE